MAFILVSKQSGKSMKVVGGNLESQKTIKTATIFDERMKEVFEREMNDKVEIKIIQTNRVQDVIIKNSCGYIQRNILNKLESEYINQWGLA